MHFEVGFIHFDRRTLSLDAILSHRSDHILIGEKIEIFAKNFEKGGFVTVKSPLNQNPRLKFWGLEQTSWMGQQDGREKRQK